MVRGLSSLNASTDPLYVIDGLATSATQFRNLNTNDIETISVLRDAAHLFMVTEGLMVL